MKTVHAHTGQNRMRVSTTMSVQMFTKETLIIDLELNMHKLLIWKIFINFLIMPYSPLYSQRKPQPIKDGCSLKLVKTECLVPMHLNH